MKGSLPYLQILAKAKPKLRKILIENVPESVITAICKCCLNLLKGVYSINAASEASFGAVQDTTSCIGK